MRKLFLDMKSGLKSIIFITFSLLLCNFILTAALNRLAAAFNGGEGDLKYSPAHFKNPILISGIPDFVSGFAYDYNYALSFLAILLVLIFVVFVLLIGKQVDEWEELPPSEEAVSFEKTARKTRATVWISLLTLIVLAFVIKTAFFEPLSDSSGRGGSFLGFYVDFNKAIIAKTGFKEKEYQALMFNALKRSRNEYLWFARSGYWAYYESEKRIRSTGNDRKIYAAKELFKMFKSDTLEPSVIVEAIKLNMEAGRTGHAKEMEKRLLGKNPGN